MKNPSMMSVSSEAQMRRRQPIRSRSPRMISVKGSVWATNCTPQAGSILNAATCRAKFERFMETDNFRKKDAAEDQSADPNDGAAKVERAGLHHGRLLMRCVENSSTSGSAADPETGAGFRSSSLQNKDMSAPYCGKP